MTNGYRKHCFRVSICCYNLLLMHYIQIYIQMEQILVTLFKSSSSGKTDGSRRVIVLNSNSS